MQGGEDKVLLERVRRCGREREGEKEDKLCGEEEGVFECFVVHFIPLLFNRRKEFILACGRSRRQFFDNQPDEALSQGAHGREVLGVLHCGKGGDTGLPEKHIEESVSCSVLLQE